MFPTLEAVQAYAQTGAYRRVPVCKELLADRFTPVEALRTLRSASCHCFLLESAEQGRTWGRYSFLGCNPTMELTCTNGLLSIREGAEGEPTRTTEQHVEHPGDALRGGLARYASPAVPGMPPLAGGLVGYFAYDYIKYAEPRLREHQLADRDFRDVDLMLFDQVIVFDNLEQKLKIIAGVDLTDPDGIKAAYTKAQDACDRMIDLLTSGSRAYFPALSLQTELAPRFSQAQFADMVMRAKRYIHEGDIFQVVLSNPLSAPARGSLLDVYRVLRATNPSPYMFFFSSDDIELAGASPETLTRLENGCVKTAVDAIDAILPAGTLSGAPKLRAAEIIQELEGAKRGIYGGAIGYLDFTGNMDTCISIRLAYKKDGRVCVQSGSGIVADSVPETEYAECRNKARAVVRAIELAQGGVR